MTPLDRVRAHRSWAATQLIKQRMQTADWQLLFSDRFTGARNPARLPTKDAIPSNPLRPLSTLVYHCGKILLCLVQDFENRAPVGGRKPGIFLVLFRPGEYLPHALVNRVFGLGGQRVEGLAVDPVAARIAQQAALQIQVAQAAALTVTGATRGEGCCESGTAWQPGPQWSFIDQQQVIDKFPRRVRQEAVHTGALIPDRRADFPPHAGDP